MRNTLLALHAVFAAVWLGCIITEALFERALLPKGNEARVTLAHLHVRVDQWIEIPAIVVVLITGVLLFTQGDATGPAFHTMLGAGVIAIAANFYCVWLVFQRRDAAVNDDWARFEALDHQQHRFGAIVLVGVLVALIAGYAMRMGA